MPNFTAGTSFTDGVTNDVTALKLNALIADAVPTSSLALNSTTGTIGLFSSGTGTAATPAIQPTGDTNTGIFFPAADTIAFSEGGTEAMRIDSSGRVGIGTNSPTAKLEIIGGSTARPLVVESDGVNVTANIALRRANSTSAAGNIDFVGNDNSVGFRIGANDDVAGSLAFKVGGSASGNTRLLIDSSGRVLIGTSSASGGIAAGGLEVTDRIAVGGGSVGTPSLHFVGDSDTGVYQAGTNGIGLVTGGTERLRIDSSGRVGIGTTSPLKELQINATEPTIRLEESSAGSKRLELSVNSNAEAKVFANQSGGTLILGTVGTERLRITSGGEVYIAGTTDQGAYNLQVNGTGVWGAGAYVNGSDSRIKEDIQPIASGLDVVEKLNPVTYKYKETWSSDQSIQSGFIAQELLTALDGQIYANGVVQQGGAEGYYSVAYQNLIAILTKAIQELKSENDSLKARVAALEAA